eukprot:140405-Pleurochrysis_carterae.AAC.1
MEGTPITPYEASTTAPVCTQDRLRAVPYCVCVPFQCTHHELLHTAVSNSAMIAERRSAVCR